LQAAAGQGAGREEDFMKKFMSGRKWMGRRMGGFLAAGCLLVTASLSGCAGEIESEAKMTKDVEVLAQADYPKEPVYKDDNDRWEDRKGKEVPETFKESYNAFAIQTTSALFKDRSENSIYSPLGLYYALAFASQGAEGTTREEMLALLGYKDGNALAEDCKAAFEALYHVPNEKNSKKGEWGEYAPESRYTLQIANSLWAEKGMDLKEDFLKRAAEYYYADVFQANLSSEEAKNAQAEWVKERTNGLIVPSAPASDTVLSLKNTIYFYDEWMDRFSVEKTAEDIFTCADGKEVTCDFMNRTMSSHGFRKGENYTTSTLSLKNGSMEFYLPDEGVDVHELLKSPEVLQEVMEGEEGSMMGEVVWKVPKFSYGSGMGLIDMLKNLGMQEAFLEGEADFTNISDMKPLFISNVSQNAHIGIDENGVEAAAYTEISWAGAALPKGRADMILDRPFLYVIRNRGQVIFVGICENPAAG